MGVTEGQAPRMLPKCRVSEGKAGDANSGLTR